MELDIAEPTASDALMRTVVAGGYCIGCGACASLTGSGLEVAWNDDGRLEARRSAESLPSRTPVDEVCPFSDAAADEDVLAADLFSAAPHFHPAVGRHSACYVGSVTDSTTRASASSGGLGRFIAATLLSEGHVERVAHVIPHVRKPPDGELFAYALTHDPQEVLDGATSAYYPVSLDAVFATLTHDDVPTAVVGVPCFIKALRLLARRDERIRRNVRFTIGLFCGGLRSARYAEMIGWQLGVGPNRLSAINFREKYADRPANHKGNRVHTPDGDSRLASSKELFGTDYGMGFFKPIACDYCDDVTAELADVSVGDAWLPTHVGEARGASVVVVRSDTVRELLAKHAASGRLDLDPVSADTVATSQASGLRHRREGTAYRCSKQASAGNWAPRKRDFGMRRPSTRRMMVYDLRESIRDESQAAFAEARARDDYTVFEKRMAPLVRRYQRVLNPLGARVLNRLKRMVRGYLRRPAA